MDTLYYLLPEVILSAFALAIFLLDLFWRERGVGRLNWVAIVGMVAALAATIALWIPAKNVALFCSACLNAGPQDASNLVFSKDALYVSDYFTNFFRLIAILIGFLVLFLSFEYLQKRMRNRGEFLGIFFLSVAAMIFMAGSTNLLMIYLATEFLSYTSYILTGMLREDKKSNEAAIKYFLFGAVTSAIMLYGISLFYGATGSLSIVAIGEVFHNLIGGQVMALFAIGLMLAGFGFKISLVPFHQWAPDAYEGAPTPVTAFLSVGPKSAGFAILLRVILTTALPFQDLWVAVLSLIAILTMTIGNLIAIQQTNIKRLLAYSSIAQAGYMLIGLVAVSTSYASVTVGGVNGLLIYILAYVFTNLGAFACVIAIENATGAVDISQYGGMIKRAPTLAVLFVIFFLSLAGIPPTAGFIGKFFVFAAALNTHQYALAIIGVLNSVLSVVYYFKVVRPMFFDPAPEASSSIPISRWLNAVLVIATVMVFVIALIPTPFYTMATYSFTNLFGVSLQMPVP